MKIEVRFRGLVSSPAMYELVVRRIHVHLSRFGRQLSGVFIRIGDINGPKGGVDKRCQVTVRGPRVGTTSLEDLSGDTASAIDMALERVARAVGRSVERTRSLRYARAALRPAP